MPTPPTDRDHELVRLFRWATLRYGGLTKKSSFVCTPETLVRLLSVEGLRDELKVIDTEDIPASVSKPLRYFRKLDQEGRLRRAVRLLKECQ